MSWLNDEFVLLKESISGTVLRFEAAHAAALLAYPGTLWAEVKEEVKEEVHEAAQAVADWSAAPAAAPEEAAEESSNN